MPRFQGAVQQGHRAPMITTEEVEEVVVVVVSFSVSGIRFLMGVSAMWPCGVSRMGAATTSRLLVLGVIRTGVTDRGKKGGGGSCDGVEAATPGVTDRGKIGAA